MISQSHHVPHDRAYLVECPISQCNSHNDRQTQANFARVLVFLDLVKRCQHKYSGLNWSTATHKVDINLLDRTGPAIKPKHFVCKVDTFIRGQIVYFLSCGTRSRRDVFGSQFSIKASLQCGYFLCGIFADPALRFFEGIGDSTWGIGHTDGCGSATVLVAHTEKTRSAFRLNQGICCIPWRYLTLAYCNCAVSLA